MLNLELDLVEGYTLFGVRTKLNDFTLAYNLNKKLNMNFFREDDDLTIISFNQKIYFSLFNFYDEQNDNMWSIIKNKARIKNLSTEQNSLFSNDQMTSYKFLIKECKNFDYIIKVTGIIFNKKEIIYLINKVNNIEIASEINDLERLSIQSKQNLCF